MTSAYVGLGSNLGDRRRYLGEALARLSRCAGIQVADVSRLYESDPVGVLDQPRFLNAAAWIPSSLTPRQLLSALLDVERQMGRIRTRKWGPRNIDLDLLLFGTAVIRQKGLTLPHPHLAKRPFVLAPLCDLDESLVHPCLTRTVGQLYRELCGETPLRPAGRLDWKSGELLPRSSSPQAEDNPPQV